MEDKKIYPEELDEEEDSRPQNIISANEVFDEDSQQMYTDELDNRIDMLQGDPHNIVNYQQSIEHYKQLGKPETVQQIRMQANKQAVLTQEMWKDWIEDALIEATSFQERKKISEIFDMALDSFNYFDIAKKYGEHILALYTDAENDGSIRDKEVKKVLDKILRVWLLDLGRSSEIWQLYLKFEAEIRNWRDTEEDKRQKEIAIRGLYKKKLLFPSIDIDEIWDDYKEWEKDEGKVKEMEERYKKSNEKIELVIKFEDNVNPLFKDINTLSGNSLFTLDLANLLEYYQQHLPDIAGNNFSYYELYIERLLCKCPAQDTIWEYYLTCADLCKSESVKNQIYRRAYKNCRDNIDFKLGYLRSQEKLNVSIEEFKKNINEFIEDAADNPQLEYMFRKEYIEYLSRHLNSEHDNELAEEIRRVFTEAIQEIPGI